jgi:hypothetical protein
MKNKILLPTTFAALLLLCPANAHAEAPLPNDPWAGIPNPTIDASKHSPYSEQTISRTSINNLEKTANEYFNDIPNKPKMYNDGGEISVEYITFLVDRLRNMGYEIDPKVDNFIAKAPSKLRGTMLNALADLRKSSSKSIEGKVSLVLDDLENLTGFNMENIIDNTTRLMEPK